ncbi:MAG: hypothetical protein KBC27_00195 [Rickettsiales bacterium]|nr:hypothetical protein [Rickettsiales bacterium]
MWQATEPFKGGYRTNGLKSNKREYYRWDERHKDVEIYDHNARYLGSKDPVTGKAYRKGDMKINFQLKDLK